MFIHFNCTAGVLLSGGVQLILTLSDRAEMDHDGSSTSSLVSLSFCPLYHLLFICLCLFTGLVSIHLPPVSQPCSPLPSDSLQLLSSPSLPPALLLSGIPTFDLQCVRVYLYFGCQGESLCFLSVSQELYIRPRLSFCLSICLSICVLFSVDVCMSQGTQSSSPVPV